MTVFVFINVLTGEIAFRTRNEIPFGGSWMLKGISKLPLYGDDGSAIAFEGDDE